MLFSQIELSDTAGILGIVIVSMAIGALGMLAFQHIQSRRLRRFMRKNCAACMSADTDALLTHMHPITPANRDAASRGRLGSIAALKAAQRGAADAGRKDKR